MADGASGSEFDALLREVDELGAIINPESTPYVSHYRIIETVSKWLTTPLQRMEAAIANAKLGATYLHVEEPHNAQPALEKAATILFPELLAYANASTPSAAAASTLPSPSAANIKELLANLPVVRIEPDAGSYAEHILELLNQTGILWFNRSLPLRALCYFKACAVLCSHLGREKTSGAPVSNDDNVLLALRTHAYFYLAQVYGSLQRADESALYCLATLELQLLDYAAPASATDGAQATSVHEWVKNALRLVDYYIEAEHGSQAAVCLDACEYMVSHHLRIEEEGVVSDDAVTAEERDQRRAEIHLAWARLHQQTLQLAQLHREGVATEPRQIEYVDTVAHRVSLQELLVRLQSSTENGSSVRMKYSSPQQVISYEDAREVFKMGTSASDASLKVFVLDGYVTAHIQLLQLQSQLYRRLISWETDLKRQTAMQLRRLALLTPLLGDALNPRAYCAKLQELYYESAEVAAEIFDLKQFKKRGDTDAKTTAYILKAINWYQQYLFLFYVTDDSEVAPKARVTGQDSMIIGGKVTPLPTSTTTPTELKSVLHGFFSLARACSKVVVPQDHEKTVLLWKKAIDYNEAVLTLIKKYEQKPSNEANASHLKNSFKAEMGICEEMLELLPEKINQLVYNGKAL